MTKKLGIDFHMVANDVYESYDKGQKPKNKDLKELYELSKEYIEEYEETMTKEKEVKDRIKAYVEETWRCLVDQEASMKENDLKCMFEQILEDGKQLAKEKQ